MSALLNRRQRGQTFVLGAVGIIALIGMLAMVIDVGRYYLAREETQKMADAAALAAVMEWPADPAPVAQDYADRNSAVAKAICTQFDPPVVELVLIPPTPPTLNDYGMIALPQRDGSPGATGPSPSLHVRVTCGMTLIFGRILWETGEAPILKIEADATAVQGCGDQFGAVYAYVSPCSLATPPPSPTPDPRPGARLIR